MESVINKNKSILSTYHAQPLTRKPSFSSHDIYDIFVMRRLRNKHSKQSLYPCITAAMYASKKGQKSVSGTLAFKCRGWHYFYRPLCKSKAVKPGIKWRCTTKLKVAHFIYAIITFYLLVHCFEQNNQIKRCLLWLVCWCDNIFKYWCTTYRFVTLFGHRSCVLISTFLTAMQAHAEALNCLQAGLTMN